MAQNYLVAVMFSSLVLGALTECATSTGGCAGVDPGTDAATLLQAEAVAERHLPTSQEENHVPQRARIFQIMTKVLQHTEDALVHMKQLLFSAGGPHSELTPVSFARRATKETSADMKDLQVKIMLDIEGIGNQIKSLVRCMMLQTMEAGEVMVDIGDAKFRSITENKMGRMWGEMHIINGLASKVVYESDDDSASLVDIGRVVQAYEQLVQWE